METKLSLHRRDTSGAALDLSACDAEPIHLIGHVQPHGVLFALDPADLRIEQVSESAGPLLGLDADRAIGHLASAVIRPPLVVQRLKAMLGTPRRPEPKHVALTHLDGYGSFDWLAHRHDGIVLLEAEPATPDERSLLRSRERLRQSVDRCDGAQGLDELASIVTEEIQQLAGYERVMLYRFAKDQSGHVIAESVADGCPLERFLGLHFPATDIPQQARRMLRGVRSRLLVDRGYEPARLAPVNNPRTGRPLDLSYASLRGVSPIHLRYLENMGVRASLTISILLDGKLWGLIACHHHAGPRHLTYEVRTNCDVLSLMTSLCVRRQCELEHHRRRAAVRAQHGALTQWIRERPLRDPSALLFEGGEYVRGVVDAGGFAVRTPLGDRWLGPGPDPVFRSRLVDWLDERATGEVWQTESLFEAGFPDAEAIASQVSGVLAVRLAAHQMVLWMRPEVPQTVAWAGDPNKPFEPSGGGTPELTPRHSFAAWTETVRRRAVPWKAVEIDAARAVRGILVDAIYLRAEELRELNERLRKQNKELDAFAQTASHDLREPLRTIRNYVDVLREDHRDALNEDGRLVLDRMASVGDRMRERLESLIEFARSGHREMHREPLSLGDVVAEALGDLALRVSETGAEVVVGDPLPDVFADRVMLGGILVNLIDNALKYSDRKRPHVEIGVERARPEWREMMQGAPFCVFVRDHGIGIAPADLEAVFQIFKRLHDDVAYGGGFGVGLSIVQNLVLRHGGRIWVESEPRKGTTFYFTLATGPEHA